MIGKVRVKADGVMDEEPMSLQDIIYKYICTNLDVITYEKFEKSRHLRDGIILPSDICDRLLDAYQQYNRHLDDTIATLFQDTRRTSLRVVHLRNGKLTNYGLALLMTHDLYSLSIWYCDRITERAQKFLSCHCKSLRSLELGIGSRILQSVDPHDKEPVHFELNCSMLRRLVLNGVPIHHQVQIDHLKFLSHLDLTSCSLGKFSLSALCALPKLHTLILFNVWPLEHELQAICNLKQLRTLDISLSGTGNGHGVYHFPNDILNMLMQDLRELTHLDISGTNLAGNGVATQGSSNKHTNTDIPGLASRIERPLQFLGLYHTAHWACKRHDIPAIEIAGDANEQQILTAARYYYDRPIILTRVLNDLYHLFRFENCKNIHTALDIVLSAMDRHLKFKHMQISGSATLFYIVKGRDRNKFGTTLRNHIIRTLLNGMEMHITDDTMLRNGYLTLTQFQMPSDVLFEYKRLILVLLHGVSKTEQEGFVQRIAIYLLNTLACQVDGRQKLFLGELGVVGTMLSLIKDRLTRVVFDDVMEVAWSTMWNVTDETAINCKRFLDGHGMDYFIRCLNMFRQRDELLRNMMGLLGNVAEVKSLRPKLMFPYFIEVFADLLFSKCDGIEVSYNAAGVLAHIASDGPQAWSVKQPSRDQVLTSMIIAIRRWDIKSERNINYRSFEPILNLVCCYETPECQHWAVWALANLTQVYPDKYCQLVEQENGLEILNQLIAHPKPYDEVKQIAQMVIDRCSNWLQPMHEC